MTTTRKALPLLSLAVLALAGGAAAAPQGHPHPAFDCGFRPGEEWVAAVRVAVARGEIPDPATRPLPRIPPGNPGPQGQSGCLSRAHVFPFEDRTGLLLRNFTDGELINLMADAANAVLAAHGDNFDFIGYWVNFEPHHKIGAAFYMQLVNDVQGIGSQIFDRRQSLGFAGQRIEGCIMMRNINDSLWQAGSGSGASFTRLALAQEFEHRFAMFLPRLRDGRDLQGDNGSCGRVAHWNWRVDGQGSGMEISEWVGRNPAHLQGSFVTFNTDIVGSVFSYTDLYLMGYVSPAEMDAGNSELRYMDTSACNGDYFGTISAFSSADIIAAAGPRVPDHTRAQKAYRTAWVMLHQPGAPPTNAQLDKAVAIHRQHVIDWQHSTLGRGSMDNSLFGSCAQARIYGCGANPLGSLRMMQSDPVVGTTFQIGVDNPPHTQAAFSTPVLFLASAPDGAFPCGTPAPGLGMSAPGASGELLVSFTPPDPFAAIVGATWFGFGPAAVSVPIPGNAALIGAVVYAQGVMVDPTGALGVTVALADAAELRLGL